MFDGRGGARTSSMWSLGYSIQKGHALARQAVGRARRHGLSYTSRVIGMRWAARWIAARMDRKGWVDGRPTVLCLRRNLFAKDIDTLRQSCDLNFVCISQGILGRLQQRWVSRDLMTQTHYQYCHGSEYAKDWQRIATFGQLVMREISHLTPVDAILTGNIDYWQDQGIRMAAQKLDLPFLVLRRENECSGLVQERALKRYSRFTFEGDSVAVFGRPSLKPLVESGACREGQIVVTGAPRLDCWHDADPSNRDADTIVLLSYRDPAYGASSSFREVLELFIDCARKSHNINSLRFIVKAKSYDDHLAIYRTLASKPPNVFIEHDISLFDLFLRSRLVIGFNSLSVVEALLCEATIIVPFWGETKLAADKTMFHPSREQHGKAIVFAESVTALSELIGCVTRNEENDCESDRNTRLNVVNQYVEWSSHHTASERVESWIRASIVTHSAGVRTVPGNVGSLAPGEAG